MNKPLLLTLFTCLLFLSRSQAQIDFWGMTYSGGKDFVGTIYKANAQQGTLANAHDFTTQFPGSSSQYPLTPAPDGKLYGLTTGGGDHGGGVLFEYDPLTNTYVALYHFVAGVNYYPVGSLVLHSNGKMYGATSINGSFFEFDYNTKMVTWKITFGTKGSITSPTGTLVSVNDKLYGMTQWGGNSNAGTIFEYDPVLDTVVTRFSFDQTNSGSPVGNHLMQASNGKIFGLTQSGGLNNKGVLFEFDVVTGSFVKKFDFDGGAIGGEPGGGLAESDSVLYGFSQVTNGDVLFSYNLTSGVLNMEATMMFPKYSTGLIGDVTPGPSGELYFVSQNAHGNLFAYNPATDSVEVKATFDQAGSSVPTRTTVTFSNGIIYGLSRYGGFALSGVLFEYDPNTEIYTEKVHLNADANGGQPTGNLSLHPNGKLYGVTAHSGNKGRGVLFEMDPATGAFTKKMDFDSTGGGWPSAGLTLAPNGKFYGCTTPLGSVTDFLFEYDPTQNSFVKRASLDATTGFWVLNDLVTTGGKIYGLTLFDGSNGGGGIFEFDPSTGVIKQQAKLPSRPGSSKGMAIVAAANGKIYVATPTGGSDGNGSLFEYDPGTNALVKKIDFSQEMNFPGNFVQHPDGKIYNVSDQSIVAYDPNQNIFSSLFSFSSDLYGYQPDGLAVSPIDGKLYGACRYSNSYYGGTFFSFDPALGQAERLLNFTPETGVEPIGYPVIINTSGKQFQTLTFSSIGTKTINDAPFVLLATTNSGLAMTFTSSDTTVAMVKGNTVTIRKVGETIITANQPGSAAYLPAEVKQILTIASPATSEPAELVGVTYTGPSGHGVIFTTDPSGNNFQAQANIGLAGEGTQPIGGLVRANNGKFYGTTVAGGANGYGAIYEWTQSGTTVKKVYDFSVSDGYYVRGKMTKSTVTGKLYGVTVTGGINYGGMVFEFDPDNGAYIKKVDLYGSGLSYAYGSLAEANGKFYGTTYYGGANAAGALFEFDPATGNFLILHEFGGPGDGQYPIGGVLHASNGKLYGTTLWSNNTSHGTIFEYDLNSGQYQQRAVLADSDGNSLYAALVEFPNGKLYCPATGGGQNNFGTLLEFDPSTGALVKRLDLDSANTGSYIETPLTLSPTNKLYGTAPSGGAHNLGVIFEYDPQTNVVQKKFDFDSTHGANPYAELLYVSGTQLVQFDSVPRKTYGDVAFTLSASATSGLALTFSSSDNSIASISGNTVTIHKAGIVNITASQAGNASYSAATAQQELVIRKTSLTITAAAKTKTYGSVNPLLTFSFSGFVGSDNATVLDTLPTISTSALQFSNVGAYPIVPAGGGDHDYSFLFVNDTLTVTRAPLTITADNKTSTYGSSAALTSTYTGFVGTDNVSVIDVPPTISSTASQFSNTGNYAINLSGGSDNNYTFTLVNGTLTINKATLTVIADNKTKSFGSTNPAFTLSFSGFVGTDDASGIDGLPTISTTATTFSIPGTYAINLSSGIDNNYSLTLTNGNLTVTKATLTVTADDKSRIYGSTNPALTLSYSGFVGADNASVVDVLPSLSCAATQFSSAGAYDIVLSGGSDNNYALTLDNGTLTVGKASLTVTADDKLRRYGTANPNFTFAYSGFLGSDNAGGIDVPPTGSTSATLTSDVGSYAITPTGGSDNNYVFVAVNGTLQIIKSDQSITFGPIADQQLGESPFDLAASSSSGLSISYSATTSKSTVNGTKITLVKAGRDTVMASQSGNVDYNPAGDVLMSYCIKPAKPAITRTAGVNLNSSSPQGNQWFLNGIAIAGATATSYLAGDPGTYTVQVTADDCKSDFANNQIISITGIEPNGDVNAYPNPAGDFVYISGLSRDAGEGVVVDMMGRQTQVPMTFETDASRVDVRSFSAGVYGMRVVDNGALYVFKFVKK